MPRSPARPLLMTLALTLLTAGCTPRPTPRTTPAGPPPDRLAGDWEFRSTLSFRDGLAGAQAQLLRLSTQLKRVLDGHVTLPGLPPILSRLAAPLVKQYLDQHVPPWAREAVTHLAQLHTMIGKTQVVSVETLRPQGEGRYRGHSRWVQVTVRAGAATVTATPDQVPGLGTLRPQPYEAEDRDGRLHVRRLVLENRFAYLFRWALEALLTASTCSTRSLPCLRSLEQVVDHFLPCKALTEKLLQRAPALRAVQAVLETACTAQKAELLKLARTELNQLALTLTYAHLSGEATITSRDGTLTLTGGRWFGRLGKAYGRGRFRGTFIGRRLRR